jgi:hypothetical protein
VFGGFLPPSVHENSPNLGSFMFGAHPFMKTTHIGCFSMFGTFQHPPHMPSTKPHPRWCDFVFGTFLHPSKHAEHKTTHMSVCFRVRRLLNTPTHTEHEKTPTLVSFRVRYLSYFLPHPPNTKRHQRGCLFVFSTFPTPSCACRTQNHTPDGVFLCSASFLHMPNTKTHP